MKFYNQAMLLKVSGIIWVQQASTLAQTFEAPLFRFELSAAK